MKKRAIAKSIIQQLNNLHPPGRFIIEDRSGLVHTAYSTGNDAEDYSHPLIRNKVWVQVSDDLAIDKIMHGLREKDGNNNNEKKQAKSKEDAIANLEPIGEDLKDPLKRCSSISGESNVGNEEENSPAGQHGIFEDTNINIEVEEWDESVGQYYDLFDDTEDNRLCDGLLVEANAKDNEVGQFDDLFDDTGLHEFLKEEEESVGQFDDLFDDDIVESNRPALEEECGSLDDDEWSESRLVGHDIGRANEQHPLHDLTMSQWVGRCESASTMQSRTDQVLGYTKAALPIVLKLTDFLIEAENDEKNGQGNPIPLESIRADNVLIRSNEPYAMRGGQEVIENVWIVSSMGDNPASGTVVARLCAVGNIIYKLFAGDDESTSLQEDGILTREASACIEEEENDNHQRKRRLKHSLGRSSNCIARLASKGYPLPIQALVSNLLNCGRGDHCGDYAYTSFLDLRQDLSLMMNDPSRFLEDIQVSNGLPKLEICNKLYGRESEEVKLDQLYQQNIDAKEFKGVIISGGAGVGKSRLAKHIQKLTNEANGYFCAAKFQQNNIHVKPLSIIGTLFNSLCDRFAEDASPLQLESVSVELTNALGSQAGLLAGVVPSLSKLMPSNIQHEEGTSSTCVDAPSSMRYLFGELLRVVSSHSSRPISLFVDDIQFADHSSLLLISNLLFSAAKSDSSVFFVFCHRNNDPDYDNGAFDIWLSSISMYSLEEIKLNNMNIEGVNSLVSDALHLSPRITRQLSEVLHHKTMGNPLFVRQLLVSLTAQGYIYVDLSQPRWAWDLNKIADQEISESVLDLLMKEMKRLPTDLQLGLKVASCLGSCAQKNVLDILSKYSDTDLIDILQQVSERSFMSSVDDGATFTFAHDKIQQAGEWIANSCQMKCGLTTYLLT